MVCPSIRGKSYVGETGKSMKVGEMVVAQEDVWRKSPFHSMTGRPKALWPVCDSLGPAPARQRDSVNTLAPFALDESRHALIEVGVLGAALVGQVVGPDWVAPLPSHFHLAIRTLDEKEPFVHG